MSKAILDASALLALLRRESGSEKVEAVVPDAVISTVNLGEVLGKLVDYGMPETLLSARSEVWASAS